MDQLRLLPAQDREDPYFGVNDALKSEDATAPLLRGLGAKIDRVEVRWDQIEPARGAYDFDQLDRLVAEGERWKMNVLAVVVGAPVWAVDRPTRMGSGPPSGLDQPALLRSGAVNQDNDWASFLATVAQRYGSRIAAWEIWNEPNFRDFWHGTPVDYAHLFAIGSAAIRAENPNATILIGGLVVDDGSFLRSAIGTLCPNKDCGGARIDGVAWHIYGDPRDVERVANLTRDVFAPYHLAPPIWVTEANVPSIDPNAPPDQVTGAGVVSLDEQAAFVMQLFALGRAVGVQSVDFYRAIDVGEGGHYWGLFRNDWSPRPALNAFRTAAEWLSGTTPVSLSHPTATTTLVQLRRSNEVIAVVWNDAPKVVVVEVPSTASQATVVNLAGTTTPEVASAGNIRVTLPGAPTHTNGEAPLGAPVIIVTCTVISGENCAGEG
jgi:hypothetical protein